MWVKQNKYKSMFPQPLCLVNILTNQSLSQANRGHESTGSDTSISIYFEAQNNIPSEFADNEQSA